jgi:broad specificity phosphatase PhoE
LAGYGDVARFIDDLMEWDHGEYEGLRPDDILEKRRGWTIWKDGVPGGETVEQIGERARKIIMMADATGGDVASFSHGHLLRILAACWLALSPEVGRYFDLAPASISVLGYHGDASIVRKWNQDTILPAKGRMRIQNEKAHRIRSRRHARRKQVTSRR